MWCGVLVKHGLLSSRPWVLCHSPAAKHCSVAVPSSVELEYTLLQTRLEHQNQELQDKLQERNAQSAIPGDMIDADSVADKMLDLLAELEQVGVAWLLL